MILSVSRRTDIPAFYSEWFFQRIREGYACVRNPVSIHQISRIPLGPEVVDCIVFWTKQPEPMRKRLKELHEYPFYFQVTLTGYGSDVEPGLPGKRTVLIPAVQRLSEEIGPERVVWRYDPILFSERYDITYHLKAFEEIARSLEGYTKRVVISFLDLYRKIEKRLQRLKLALASEEEMLFLAARLAEIAKGCGMEIKSCAEEMDLSIAGVAHGSCIDRSLVEAIIGCPIKAAKDHNQRSSCGCVESIDIGCYDTCRFGCVYCYAGSFLENGRKNAGPSRGPAGPILGPPIREGDRITTRKVSTIRQEQLSFL